MSLRSAERYIPMESPSPAPGALGQQLAQAMESFTLHKVREIGVRNARANGPKIAKGKSIAALRQSSLVESESALVIAAGPSVHRRDVARQIRETDYSEPLIVAESSLGWCFRNGIRPSLVVTLDPHPERIVRWFGDPDLNQEKVQADDYYSRQDLDPHFRTEELERNKQLVELINRHGAGVPIAVASCSSEVVVRRAEQVGMDIYWWNPMYDDYDLPNSVTRMVHEMNGLPCLNAGGNVGSAAWVIAHAVLGKKRVGLVGMDFGYYADLDYGQTQYFHEIVELVGQDRLDEVFVWFENPHLKTKFYTDPAYLWYRNSLLEMVQEADCETWNCTEGGILFGPGVQWTSLRDFLTTGGRPRSIL